MIDAKENRDFATADIPGAFLQTDDASGSTHLKMEGIMVDILLDIDKDGYKPFVVKKRQWQALHVCRVSESNIWNTKCSTIILDQAKR